MVGVALGRRGVRGVGRGRRLGEVRVDARDGDARVARARGRVDEVVVERLRRALEDEAVALGRRQRRR